MTFILHKIEVNSILGDIFCAFSIDAPYHFYRKNGSISIFAYKKRGNHYKSKFKHTNLKMHKFCDSTVGHLEKGPPFCFFCVARTIFWKKSIKEHVYAKSLACIIIWSISIIYIQLAAGLYVNYTGFVSRHEKLFVHIISRRDCSVILSIVSIENSFQLKMIYESKMYFNTSLIHRSSFFYLLK